MHRTRKSGGSRSDQARAKPLMPGSSRSPSAVEIRKRIDARAAAFRKRYGTLSLTPVNYKEGEKPSALYIRDPASKLAVALDPDRVAKLLEAQPNRRTLASE
jgi:hypothetical protein